MMPALIPVVQRLAAERRRDLGLADQLEVDRQGTDLQEGGQVLGFLDAVEATGDLRPGAAVDPVGVLGEVDDRPRLDFVVEDDREVARERFGLFGADRADRRAWPRWAIWRVTSWNASRPLPVKSKVTFGWLSWSSSCLGSVMSVPERAGSSLRANQPGSAASSRLPPLRRCGSSETTIVPTGTLTTMAVVGIDASRSEVMKRSSSEDSGPAISLCGVSFEKR